MLPLGRPGPRPAFALTSRFRDRRSWCGTASGGRPPTRRRSRWSASKPPPCSCNTRPTATPWPPRAWCACLHPRPHVHAQASANAGPMLGAPRFPRSPSCSRSGGVRARRQPTAKHCQRPMCGTQPGLCAHAFFSLLFRRVFLMSPITLVSSRGLICRLVTSAAPRELVEARAHLEQAVAAMLPNVPESDAYAVPPSRSALFPSPWRRTHPRLRFPTLGPACWWP